MYPLKSFLFFLGLILLSSCSRIPKSASPEAAGLEARLTLDQAPSDQGTSPTLSGYAPGEMVTVNVEIVNRLNKKVTLMLPYASSRRMDSNINFVVRAKDGTEVLRRVPVVSRRKISLEQKTLAPGESMERSFFFVDLTRHTGAYLLQADYTASIKGVQQTHFVSPPVEFQVSGPVRWRRTNEGLLAKADAMAIAIKHFGKPVRSAQAKLVENEAGIYSWLVTLTPEEGAKVAYFVSPYGAFVESQAKVSETPSGNQKTPAAPQAPQPVKE